MQHPAALCAAFLACLLVLAGCAPGTSGSAGASDPSGSADISSSAGIPDPSGSNSQPAQTDPGSKRDAIPFAQDQLYAVAHLGYQQIEDLDYYIQNYLDSHEVPVHFLSSGDYYLIIPRYDGMELSLYQNDFNTSQSSLFYQEPDCQPFILQCNVSDIFPDATIRLTYQGETAEFSPFISLKDGTLDVGEHGLDLTKTPLGSPEP